VENIATYSDLSEKLLDDGTGEVVTLPDGSVDIYYEIREGRGRPADTKQDFAEWIKDTATSSCRLREIDRTPGGQAVNTAKQSTTLGDNVVVFGHLKDPIFDSLDASTCSMGEPAEVNILVFEDGELMLSKVSPDFGDWDLETLRSFPEYPQRLRDADVICVQNWTSFDSMNDVLHGLSDEDLGSTYIVFDPGDITESGKSEISKLVPAIQDLGSENKLVLSLNKAEMEYLIDMAEISGDELSRRLEKLRSRLGLEAAVIHHENWALRSTSTGVLRVLNLDTEQEKRTTGAGDRFNGGMAHALAADWSWEYALLLGNACAAYHVVTGETGNPESLVSFLSKHSQER